MSEFSGRILVVDDEATILQALTRVLRRIDGLDVEPAQGAYQAIEAIDEASDLGRSFDVVLSDYRMPDMVGSEVLAHAAQIFPDAGRLLVTGNMDFATVQDAVNRGGVHRVLTKPWQQQELIAAVKDSLRMAKLQQLNRQLDSTLQAQNQRLRDMNEHLDQLVHQRTTDLLDGLISALDFRDTETQWHSRRVSLYARRLGELVGLDKETLTTIEQGALLHDLGKIGVRDSVLLKPGKLTEAEWEEMRRHVIFGYELLAPISFLRGAANIVLHHHERFDGTGYPQGVRGENIVIGARIFAVVDTYDAMTSDRPYRRGLDPQVAYEEIRRCSGAQFDSEIAKAFTQAPISEWTDIRAKVEVMAQTQEEHLQKFGIVEIARDCRPAMGLAS